MKKICIISFFHTEATLCLAKSIADKGFTVDCYIVVDWHHDKGAVPGIDYHRASKMPGIVKLDKKTAPEIYSYSKGAPITYYLFRLVSFSSKLMMFNNIIFKKNLKRIRNRGYDAINIVGQWRWVGIIHDSLKDLNITHTLHEVGNHSNGTFSTELLESIIRDKSKVICPSNFSLERFRSIPNSASIKSKYIPFGKFETVLLYQQKCNLSLDIRHDIPTFLFFGMIKPYKGLDLLAKSCQMLKNQYDKFNLIIAGGGDDPNLNYFKSMNNCIVINKFLTDAEMIYLMSLTDMVLLPYKSASQSGIFSICYMLGCSAIATKVGALPEVVEDGKNGILVEPDDAIGFAHAMQSIIDDENLLTSLKKGTQAFGNKDRFDWNNIAEKTIDFLFQ